MNESNKNRRDFFQAVGQAGAGLAAAAVSSRDARAAAGPQEGSMAGFRASALPVVRAAFIGVGARGSGHVRQMMTLQGVEIVAICDNHPPSLQRSVANVVKSGRKEPAAFGNGDTDYKRMLERKDIDIVIIATPWEWHATMCVDAMESGKHAFTEVPAALSVEECWKLVKVSEKTRKYCMMMENCCYGQEELMCLNMCRQGVFGDLLHAEGSYIHDLRSQMQEVEHGTGSWRTLHYARRNGNLYPTHGLGPVAQYLGINRGDRFDYLSAVASPALGRPLYAKKKYPPDHKWNKISVWNCGDMVTTLIKTAKGRSLMVQWDETSPRPYSRLNLIQGTKGTFAGYPPRLAVEELTPNTHAWVSGEQLKPFQEKYEHPLWKKMGELAQSGGGHGGMDWLMLWRMVYCLRNGEPLDQDVYDAAAWSAVGPLSEQSIARRSTSMDIPDFTGGMWKNVKPLGIVT